MEILKDERKATSDQAEIERLLTDENGLNRWAAAQNPNFTPTDAQLRRGLNDASQNVCAVFATRFSLSDDLVSTLVKSPFAAVRYAIASREDIHLREEQWLILLFDESPQVIAEAFKRKNAFPDFLPEEKLIEKGLLQGVVVSEWFKANAPRWEAAEAKKMRAHVLRKDVCVDAEPPSRRAL